MRGVARGLAAMARRTDALTAPGIDAGPRALPLAWENVLRPYSDASHAVTSSLTAAASAATARSSSNELIDRHRDRRAGLVLTIATASHAPRCSAAGVAQGVAAARGR